MVVDPEGMQDFVLTAANGIAFDSEVIYFALFIIQHSGI